jgi:hypothetical protein
MATLRSLAISILRLDGHANIASVRCGCCTCRDWSGSVPSWAQLRSNQ